jgi:outer membrane protein
MKKKIIVACSVLAVVILCSSFYYMGNKSSDRIAYVKLSEVYKKFEMRTEMEAQYKKVEAVRKNLIDSMEFQAIKVQSSGDKAKYEIAVNEYIRKRKELEQANETLMQQYDEQIWSQINSYCEEFGETYQYDYILGAQGSGTLMYADKNNEVTGVFVDYINKMYNGKIHNKKK